MSGELLQVPFLLLDEGSDPKGLPPGTLVRAKNCAMDKFRRLVKKQGTTSLTMSTVDGDEITTGKRIQTRGDDTTVNNGTAAFCYSSSLALWSELGPPPLTRITRRGLVDSTRSAGAADSVAYNGMLVTVFLAGPAATSAIYIKVEDLETGAIIYAPTLISTNAAWPRVRVSGSTAIVVWSDSVGDIYAYDLSLTLFTSVSGAGGTALASSGTAFSPVDFDILTPSGGVPTMYVAWALSAGTDRLQWRDFLVSNFAAVHSAVASATTSVSPTAICVTANGSTKVHIAGALLSAGTVRLVTITNLTTIAAAVGTFESYHARYVTVEVDDSTNLLVIISGSTVAGAVSRMTTYLTSQAAHTAVAASVRVTWQVISHSRPWRVSSRWYIAATVAPKDTSLTVNTPIPNATGVVLEIETASAGSTTSVTGSPCTQVGTTENLTAWQPSQTGHVPQVSVVSSVAYVPVPYRNQEPLNFQSIPIGFNLYKVQHASEEDTHRLAVIGRAGLAAAGAPYWMDGASARPYGFCHAPMIIALTASAGGAMAAGDYSYVAVYEWRDANGVLHRSVPSPARTVTVTLNQRVLVTVMTSAISQKQSPPYTSANVYAANPVMVVLYRTTVGATSDHYRLTLEPEYQVLLSDPTAGSVSLSYDTKADADIGAGSPARPLSTQPKLYTDTGELADVPPPSLITVCTHRGRIAGIGPDLRTIWFTKDSTQDTTVAPGFNEALTLAFAADKTALASLDEKLVVFGENDIDIVHNNGPDATGQGNDWAIQRVQSDVGCVNPRSVVTTPFGIVFESARGLELLDRGLTITWIGRNVEDSLASFPTITSAVLVAEAEEVRFTCNASNGLTGIVLAYDYGAKFWFTRTYAAQGPVADVPFADSAVVNGVYTLLRTSGASALMRETSSSKLDDGAVFVERDILWAPLSPAGNLAWHRIKDVSVLGTSVTNHDLKISVARNYATSFEQDVTFLAGSTATAIGVLEKCRVTLQVQKCQAIQIRIQDLTPTSPGTYPVSTGDGPIIEGLAFRVSKRPGVARTAAGQQG